MLFGAFNCIKIINKITLKMILYIICNKAITSGQIYTVRCKFNNSIKTNIIRMNILKAMAARQKNISNTIVMTPFAPF
ncbi:MAG: hypothetical protein OMM_08848 [Candidatus Magnetoglobus multicellularis str. Araruama]|uniref:Uncharacterized protein n=1 Tax=Candidatus Magnetoglobus multicellularis str. Araruama TaxID=890399 RepID=A0A1V1P6I7_9BACT|nr:MAG: hypothetical protein OMM_08848 [Candidatus Magnetoglobus multicellularis str. Araruama]